MLSPDSRCHASDTWCQMPTTNQPQHPPGYGNTETAAKIDNGCSTIRRPICCTQYKVPIHIKITVLRWILPGRRQHHSIPRNPRKNDPLCNSFGPTHIPPKYKMSPFSHQISSTNLRPTHGFLRIQAITSPPERHKTSTSPKKNSPNLNVSPSPLPYC